MWYPTSIPVYCGLLTWYLGLFSLLGQTITPLQIKHLTGDFYRYTTYHDYEGEMIPAHGMYVVTPEGAIMIDTPWDSRQFQPLLDSIQHKHHLKVKCCIVTHWHSDRTAGLEYYRQQGIQTFTTKRTDALCLKNNKPRAAFTIDKDTIFQVGPYTFETYYPGPGHTDDNIVLWFGQAQILYGGCLIKGAEAENLGFTGDGNVQAYETTLQNVKKRYPHPQYIVVSHHDGTSPAALRHSIRLARRLKRHKNPTIPKQD